MKSLNRFFFSLLLLIVAGCAKHPVSSEFSVPTFTGDGWQVSSLTSQNIDVSKMAIADYALKSNPSFVYIHTLTIARNGKLLLDKFYHAGPYDYHAGDLATLQSITKSFTSILMGIAIDKGLIENVNQTAQTLLPQLKDIDWTSGKDSITLKDILTMSAGFAGSENTDSLLPSHFAQYIFSKPLKYTPGTVFDYRTALTNSLGDILSTTLSPIGISLKKFTDSLLFHPLQITNYRWAYRSATDIPELGGGLFLTPRDITKLGQLILDRGKWNGTQIVPAKWISEATHSHFHFRNRYWGELDGYGYLFWQRTLNSDNRTFSSVIALGYGGQYVVTIPELHTVITITSWFPNDKNWDFPLQFIEQYILPALN